MLFTRLTLVDSPTKWMIGRRSDRRSRSLYHSSLMDLVALGARVALAIVFATAAAGKFADQPGTRTTLADFGMPERSLATSALLLPLAELATAVALVVQQSAQFGAIAALALLLVFAGGIAAAMARGEAPECNCFGQLGSAPAGRGTLIRNAVLAVPAVFVLAYGAGKALDAWLPSRSATNVVAMATGIAMLALAAFCLRLWLENRRLAGSLARVREASAAFPPGLPIGAKAPGFALRNVDGQTITLDSLLGRGKPLALVFLSPDCGPCMMMLPTLARWQRRLADPMTIALVTKGTVRELSDFAEQHGLANVLADDKSEVFESYRGSSTPSAVILTPEGRIASPMRSTQVIVEALIRRALSSSANVRPAPPSPAANGDPFEVMQWSSTAGRN